MIRLPGKHIEKTHRSHRHELYRNSSFRSAWSCVNKGGELVNRGSGDNAGSLCEKGFCVIRMCAYSFKTNKSISNRRTMVLCISWRELQHDCSW